MWLPSPVPVVGPSVALLVLSILSSTSAQRNITIDDNDPAIVYTGNGWLVSEQSNSFNFGGFHHLSDQKNAVANFSFNGTGIYFKSPKWPYSVGATVSVDNGRPVFIDLQDHSRPDVGQGSETVNTADVWGVGNLSNGRHTLIIGASDRRYVVVDALVVTVVDTTSSSSSSQSQSQSQSQTSSSRSSSGTSSSSSTASSSSPSSSETAAPAGASGSTTRTKVVPIAVGTSLGAVCLLLLILTLLYIRRKRNGDPKDYAAGTLPPNSSRRPPSFVGSAVPSTYLVEPLPETYASGAASPALAGAMWGRPHPYSADAQNVPNRASQASMNGGVSGPYASYYDAGDGPVRMSYIESTGSGRNSRTSETLNYNPAQSQYTPNQPQVQSGHAYAV